ncbi:hypothetical protein ACPWSH_25760, partial [Pandoraea pneumonica]
LRISGHLAGATAGVTLLAGTPLRAHAATDPAYLSATDLIAQFRRGSLSPLDVLDAQIRRIESLDKQVNCVTVRHFEDARAAAREA